MEIRFVSNRNGLEVNFVNLTTNIKEGYSFIWDFGDGSAPSYEKNTSHQYSQPGFYSVTLSMSYSDPNIVVTLPTPATSIISVSDVTKTSLSGTIYDLIDNYIPSNLLSHLSFSTKQSFLEKWQLFIQPLVNHEVPIEQFNNELYYEALENQLIMECAVYDLLVITFTNLVQSVSSSHTVTESTSTGDVQAANGNVKKIVTGPSEVEFFDSMTSDSDVVESAVKAVQPGGLLDTLKDNLCTLAYRLDIMLPFCKNHVPISLPSIKPGKRSRLRGPNPRYPLR